MYYVHTRNFYNKVLEKKTLNLVHVKPKFFLIAKLSMRN